MSEELTSDLEQLAHDYAERASRTTDPDLRAQILMALATLLHEKFGDTDQATRVLIEALYETPSDDDVAKKIEIISRDRLGVVIDAINGWVSRNEHPDRVSLCLRAAKWYGDLGHAEYGAALVEKARSLAPADVRVARAWERLVAQEGPVEAIEAARRRVLELDPTDANALEGLERLHRGRGSLETFVAFLEDLVRGSAFGKLNPVRVQLARLHDELGRGPRAMTILEEAFAADRTDYVVLRALDEAYTSRKQHRDLLKVLDLRLAHDKDADRTEIALRGARLVEDEFLDPEKAAGRLKDHITRDPEAAPAYVALAKLHSKRKKFEQALDTLELAVEVLSDSVARADACLQIAKIRLDELNDPTGAIDILEQGRKLDGANDSIAELLARAYDKAGDTKKALTAMVGVAHLKEDPAARADALVLAAKHFIQRVGDTGRARRLYQEALRHQPDHLEALSELRMMMMSAGQWDEAAVHLDRLQRNTPGAAARGKLLVELGIIRRTQLGDEPGALAAFEEALAIDPESENAAMPIAQTYFDSGRYEEAAEIVARLLKTTRTPEVQRSILNLQGRIASARNEHSAAVDAYKRSVKLGERRPEVLDALAESAIAAGQPIDALSAQKTLLSTIPPSSAESAQALIRLGEIKLSLGDLRGASTDFEQALAIDPDSRRATEAVVQIAANLQAWEHLEMWEKRLLELVDDQEERRTILRKAADRWVHEAKDLRRAIHCLSGLLEIDPTDRPVLHEILGHRQTLGDYRGVANTIEWIVALDPDRSRRAKYLVAAAKVHRDELKDDERAIQLFERALDDDPSQFEAFHSVEQLISKTRDFRRLERAYRKMIHRARPLNDTKLEFQLWHALGLIYRDRLNEPESAVEAFRMATQLRPDDVQERRIVVELYESVERSDLAVAELTAAIERDPLTVDHHRALFALHTRSGDRERAYMSASALVVLGAADDQVRAAFEAERPRGLPQYRSRLLPGYWRTLLAHPDLDPGVCAILASVARAARVAKARNTSLPRGSLPPKRRENPSAPTTVASATFFRVAQVLGISPPELYVRPDIPGAFAPVACDDRTTIMGSTLLEGWGERELGFIAAKHLASIDGEHEVRALFPAKTELRAILLAAISIGMNSSVGDDVLRIARALVAVMTEEEMRVLRGTVQKFNESGGKADIERFIQCAELTTLRAAMVACGDLLATVQMVRMETMTAGDLSPADKIRDLIRFALGERHFEVRKMIEIAKEGPASAQVLKSRPMSA
jgi:golgin subfamily B member 1